MKSLKLRTLTAIALSAVAGVALGAVGSELLSKVVYGLIMRRRDPGVLHLRI